MNRLKDEVAVVTGGGQGIGAAICARLASEGARVLVTDIDAVSAQRVAEGIRDEGGRAVAERLDVRDSDDLEGLDDRVRETLGQPASILVCNAGVQSFGRAVELTPAEWKHVLDVNVHGVNQCLRLIASLMPSGSSAVLIASLQGRLPAPLYPHYAASKAAALSIMKSFALALARHGIRVNAVAPGMIDTPLWERASRELGALRGMDPNAVRAERLAANPLGRAGTPADVAAAAAFLASDDAGYITGETIHVCGGDLML